VEDATDRRMAEIVSAALSAGEAAELARLAEGALRVAKASAAPEAHSLSPDPVTARRREGVHRGDPGTGRRSPIRSSAQLTAWARAASAVRDQTWQEI
jgi:hypothetical protein